jgi:hypothetical protein
MCEKPQHGFHTCGKQKQNFTFCAQRRSPPPPPSNDGGFILSALDIDPTLNAVSTARFWDTSIPTLNRRIRKGQHPPADFVVGPYRFWKLSTLVAARERRIGEAAAQAGAQRKALLEAAAHAREGKREARAERDATSTT